MKTLICYIGGPLDGTAEERDIGDAAYDIYVCPTPMQAIWFPPYNIPPHPIHRRPPWTRPGGLGYDRHLYEYGKSFRQGPEDLKPQTRIANHVAMIGQLPGW